MGYVEKDCARVDVDAEIKLQACHCRVQPTSYNTNYLSVCAELKHRRSKPVRLRIPSEAPFEVPSEASLFWLELVQVSDGSPTCLHMPTKGHDVNSLW